jgi:hypothetical protein
MNRRENLKLIGSVAIAAAGGVLTRDFALAQAPTG